jgi:hypothetical protein
MLFSLEPKQALWSIQKKTAVILLVMLIGSGFYRSGKVTIGVLLGGIISLGNLTVLGKIIENIYSQERPNRFLITCQYVLKLSLLYGLIYFLIINNVMNIIAFVCGFSVFLLGVITESLFPARRPQA